ncbi:hypothetical protein TNCT_193371 [Trichonephila clavata]|uniref:Uncharacterized protein n=1 Tax=Trichonephila clavata TaxID=2740835 RepID=A0A8X6M357_TRICU|nr:hypothetical protein TNCT_193371 [Trichonephila clavata]
MRSSSKVFESSFSLFYGSVLLNLKMAVLWKERFQSVWTHSVWSTPAEPYDGKEPQELMKMAAFSDGSCC